MVGTAGQKLRDEKMLDSPLFYPTLTRESKKCKREANHDETMECGEKCGTADKRR